MHQIFHRYAHRYDLHTPPEHYRDDHDFVLELARKKSDPVRLLDVGCGTGVLIERARKNGIDAYGIDASAEMVETATRRLGQGAVDRRRMQEISFAGDFDVVTALSWTLNYCDGDLELADILRRCRNALRPKGTLVAQVAHAAHATGELYEDVESGPEGQENDVRFLYRFASLENSALRADYVYACMSANELAFETHVLQMADVRRVAQLVSATGFNDVRIFDSWRGDAFRSSVSPFIVARI